MADIRQDLLGLAYSQSFEIQGRQEEDVNLSLDPAASGMATVYGTVTDGTQPLPDATVKLFDSQGLPYRHTMTGPDGTYSMDGVPAGSYTVSAALSGYRMSAAAALTVAGGDTVEAALVCPADASLALGAVAGVVNAVGSEGSVPLAGAKVSLLDSLGTVLAVTYTADDGEFVFYDMADGVYSLLAAADGYLAAAPMAVTITGGSFSNVALAMAVDSRTYAGTISGMVRNASGAAVAGCFVGLYQVTEQSGLSVETLLAATKTNEEGKYLFGGVGSGQYLVKAKLEQ